jgi:anion-transporting  ArsA/GET3 family ATPase
MGTAVLDHRLLFVTGKGGVGRTTVAAALSMLAAEQGRRALVCQLDPTGGLPDALDAGPLRFEPAMVEEGLWAMSMDTEASLREYLRLNLRIPLVARLGPLAHAFDFVANAAPGVKEILTVGKVCYEVREGRWDLVVVDASPSGQVVGQLDAPRAINELVRVGLVREQTAWMNEILSDPARTGAVIVTTPEEMPVGETLELADRLRAQTTVSLAAVVVNRVLPELFGRREEEAFRRLGSPDGLLALSSALGEDASPLVSAASLAVTLRRTGAGHLERLRAGTDASVPLLYLPYLFSRSHGLRATRQVSAALAAELSQ